MSWTSHPIPFTGPPPQHWKPPTLTPAQREEIIQRRANGEGKRDLAAEFGVSVQVIGNLSTREPS